MPKSWRIVKKNIRLPFNKLSAYYIENGEIAPCTDNDFEAIDNEVIDGASRDINDEFDEMVELVDGNDGGSE